MLFFLKSYTYSLVKETTYTSYKHCYLLKQPKSGPPGMPKMCHRGCTKTTCLTRLFCGLLEVSEQSFYSDPGWPHCDCVAPSIASTQMCQQRRRHGVLDNISQPSNCKVLLYWQVETSLWPFSECQTRKGGNNETNAYMQPKRCKKKAQKRLMAVELFDRYRGKPADLKNWMLCIYTKRLSCSSSLLNLKMR